jgi:hypothetical protein
VVETFDVYFEIGRPIEGHDLIDLA